MDLTLVLKIGINTELPLVF